MRTIQVSVTGLKVRQLDLGHQGENAATQVVIDYRAWRDEFGEGVPSLIHKRVGDADPYPVSVAYGDTYVAWTVSPADTEKVGEGECELVYTVDGTVVKSRQWGIVTKRSLSQVESPQDPWRDWLDKTTVKVGELVAWAREQVGGMREVFDRCMGEWGQEFQDSQELRDSEFMEAQASRAESFTSAEQHRAEQFTSRMGQWSDEVGAAVEDAGAAADNADDAADFARAAGQRADVAAGEARAAGAEVKADYAADKAAWDSQVQAAAKVATDAGEQATQLMADIEGDYEQNVVTDYERRTQAWQTQLDEKATKDELAATIHEQEATDLMQDKRIENLEAAAKGVLYREDVDATEAYTKDVPAGAMPWASVDNVGGKTIVWNQLRPEGKSGSVTQYGIVNSFTSDNLVRFYGTTEKNVGLMFGGGDAVTSKVPYDLKGHKILVTGPYSTDYVSCYYKAAPGDSWTNAQVNRTKGPVIFTPANSCNHVWVGANFLEGVTYDESFRLMYFDLTQMFGAGNEPTTVEQFRAMFPDEYYPYNPGELMSAEVVEVESRGKNLLPATSFYSNDRNVYTENGVTATIEDDGSIKLNGTATANTDFYLTDTLIYTDSPCVLSVTHSAGSFSGNDVMAYAHDKSYQSGRYKKTVANGAAYTALAENVGYVKFELCVKSGCTLNNAVFKLQVERGTTATPYSPYGTKDTFPIPDEVREMCPGYGWSAGSVYNEIDFERKKYVQRAGSVDLGTLTWAFTSSGGRWYSSLGNMAPNSTNNTVANITCAEYRSGTPSETWTGAYAVDKTISAQIGTSRQILLRDTEKNSYATAAEFKAAMAGIVIYYELAEPIEVDLSDVLPDDHSIKVEGGGTLTFKNALGDEHRIPVPNQETFVIKVSDAI